jgi:hypothetical protein
MTHSALLGLDMVAVGLVEPEGKPAEWTDEVARLTDDTVSIRLSVLVALLAHSLAAARRLEAVACLPGRLVATASPLKLRIIFSFINFVVVPGLWLWATGRTATAVTARQWSPKDIFPSLLSTAQISSFSHFITVRTFTNQTVVHQLNTVFFLHFFLSFLFYRFRLPFFS